MSDQQPAAVPRRPSRRGVLRTGIAAGAVGGTGIAAASAAGAFSGDRTTAARPATRRSRPGKRGYGCAGWASRAGR
ncbi:hypothetical protein IHE61_16665 [Streptomyces sp. GKU 257-1]|nr:hypothetical protein [Streptomyces sp. GKU 257-1]